MTKDIYCDIAQRTDAIFILEIVGPVRTGKSTFIKRFMETLVILILIVHLSVNELLISFLNPLLANYYDY